MSVSSRSSISNNSANQSYFATSFIRKAHQVVKLGYIQDGDVETYAVAIEDKLKFEPKSFRVQQDGNWQRAKLVKGLGTFRSRHSRSKAKAVDVVHTLLAFC